MAEQTIQDKLQDIQNDWSDKVRGLNEKMKDLAGLDSLLNVVYSERQNIVEYYSNLMVTMSKLTREYTRKYAEYYNKLKLGEKGIKYTNESALNTQIEAQLTEDKEPIQLLNAHIEFVKDTIKNIDGIIFGINNKIKVYELMNGIKH